MNAVRRFELLTQKGDIIICRYAGIQCVLPFPWREGGMGTVNESEYVSEWGRLMAEVRVSGRADC